MWTNAQRDGCPAEYRWSVLNAAKFGSRPLLGCHAVKLPLGQCKTWRMQSEFSMWQNSVTGQQPPQMYISSTSPGNGQTLCKVSLASIERRRCSNESKMRKPLKLRGCPKLPDRSQALVGQSLPYCEDMWRRYCCLTRFFRLLIHALVAKIQPDKVVRWCPDGDFFATFCVLYFQQAMLQHVSDLHLKFALRPHHVCKYGRHPICNG